MRFKRLPLYLFAMALLTACEGLFFYPEKALLYHPDTTKAAPVDAVFRSKDGTPLHGWFFRASAQKDNATVFFLHGNAQNISYHSLNALFFLEAGYNVFTFDYRGYGASHGAPDIKGVTEDVRAAFDYLISGELGEIGPIIIMGQSMGGALAVKLASENPSDKVKVLIADSAFSSWRGIYREKLKIFWFLYPFTYPFSFSIASGYDPVDVIVKIPKSIKVLLIHGEQDSVVPYSHSLALFKRDTERFELWSTPYEGHIRALQEAEFRKKLLTFIEESLR